MTKKTKNNYFYLDIDLFKYSILIFIKPKYKEIKDEISSEYIKELKITRKRFKKDNNNYAATCYRGRMKTLLIVSELDSLYNTLPHEASHIARHIMHNIGADLDEEVFAYITGYISQFFFKCIDTYNEDDLNKTNDKK